MARYINGTGGSYLSPNMQYFGLQNPYGNPNYQAFQSCFGPTPLLATIGNLPAENLGPDKSAAIPGEGPEGNKVGSDVNINRILILVLWSHNYSVFVLF